MIEKIAIGVLAYNEGKHIQSVLNDLIKLNLPIYIVNDFSNDDTQEILSKFKSENIKVILNSKNIGAGASTKKLFQKASEDGYDFLIKVDGDGQFSQSDIIKIVDLYKTNKYDFIKSNRFWSEGIKGEIPKIRFFGNLFATLLLQITAGTNKLYDPLNGLFGVSLKIIDFLNDKKYPRRYGYPYFITVVATLNNFKTYQINNVVEYGKQESNLSSLKVFFTILKLTTIFYIRKYRQKKLLGKYQRSALFDVLFFWTFCISVIIFVFIIYISFYATFSLISTGNLLILYFVFLFISIISFVNSFKEEKNIRNEYIEVEI